MMILMESSQIPQLLVPWLALVLILLCLWVLIQVTRDIKKNGVTKMHVRIFLPTLATILMLGFGSTVLGTVMNAVATAQETAESAGEKAEKAQKSGDFIRAILSSLGPFANQQDFTRSLSLAQTDQDKMLAFQLYAQNDPTFANAWLTNPQNQTMFVNESGFKNLQNQLEPLIAALEERKRTKLEEENAVPEPEKLRG